jgi:hypothetical protein
MSGKATFHCLRCNDTYQGHWRDEREQFVCKECADRDRGDCRLPHLDGGCGSRKHLCAWRIEEPGGPCRWCGDPVPLDRTQPCPNCWETFDGMAIADIKGVFAADAENAPEGSAVFEIRPVVEGGPDAD